MNKSTAKFSEPLPQHIEDLHSVAAKLIKSATEDPLKIVSCLSAVVAEASVVIPHNKKINDLESELAGMQKNCQMSKQRHEWRDVYKGVCTKVIVESLDALDSAISKFRGSTFNEDADLSTFSHRAIRGL